MYRAIELVPSDRDLHRFVWRRTPEEPLQDYRMTRVTFGVSASSFATNMSLKQNALDFAVDYPQAAKVVEDFSMLMMASLVQIPYKMPLSCANSSKSFSRKVVFS